MKSMPPPRTGKVQQQVRDVIRNLERGSEVHVYGEHLCSRVKAEASERGLRVECEWTSYMPGGVPYYDRLIIMRLREGEEM